LWYRFFPDESERVVNLLFFGDVVGKPGRRALARFLPELVERHDVDLVSVNVENAAGGFGLTVDIYHELCGLGIDVLTSGNHIWDKKDLVPKVGELDHLLRPANFPPRAPGRGAIILDSRDGPVAFLNLAGRVFMPPVDCPFRTADQELAELGSEVRMIVVDFHAEASSEKKALAVYLDGKVSAVLGTHTHVPTADECILPAGTAFVTDVGMIGPINSVIGMKAKGALDRFLTGVPHPFEVASGPVLLLGLLVAIDPATGKALSIQRIQRTMESSAGGGN
jgi:metallophosphoesterase (TIGR00282 family)